jgi:putative photosynthetic complex assembly protein
MSALPQDNSPPRAALIAVVTLLCVTLLLIAIARRANPAPEGNMPSVTAVKPIHAEAALHFADRADGAVIISAATDGKVVMVLEPGTHGFVRGALRGLARDRRMQGIGAGPPFVLTQWQDGQLTLRDTATGRTIDLRAFGVTQTAAFAAILAAARAPSN